MQSEAIRGHQMQSEPIRCNQRPSEAIRGHQRPSEAIRCNQRPSAHLLEAFGYEFRAREVDHLEPILEAHHPEELVDRAARGGWAGAHLRIAISRN